MSFSKIPPRHPIGDPVAGFVLQFGEVQLLSQNRIEGTVVLYEGAFLLRYGVVFLGKPHMSIVPALLALDYGEFLTSERAWHFLFSNSNLHPRADVIGYRNDGTDDMVVVKALDLMHPLHLLVYESDDATMPLAQVRAIIAAQPEQLPARVREYAPYYESVDMWRRALQ